MADNKKVIEVIKKVAARNNIKFDFKDLNCDLRSLKVDSLAAMNLIMQIEEELDTMLDDDKLIKIKTLNDLIEAFANN